MVSGDSFQQTRDNLGKQDDTKDLVLIGPFNETLIMEEGPTVLKARDVSADTIWNSFNWNASNWDNIYSSGFFLGNATFGVLGTSKLGDSPTSLTFERVVNPNNKFICYFRYNLFENSSTTATWNTTDGQLEFTTSASTVAISEPVFKNNQTVFKATPSITTANFDGGRIWLKTDSNAWEEATNNVEHTFTNTGTVLYWKIDNQGDIIGTANFPTAFGTWGLETNPTEITITKLTIQYTI